MVEDDDGLRSLIARGLRSRGYSVIEASNGIEAMEALEQRIGVVDLVVSDVVMPEMDGPTLLKTMRSRNPDLIGHNGNRADFDEILRPGCPLGDRQRRFKY